MCAGAPEHLRARAVAFDLQADRGGSSWVYARPFCQKGSGAPVLLSLAPEVTMKSD